LDVSAGLDPEVHTDRDLLMQARMRALASLQVACAPNHRATLEHTIADLDRRIADLAKASASEAATELRPATRPGHQKPPG
jgi:hypothetical protein